MAFDLLDIQNDVYKYEANEGQMKEVTKKLWFRFLKKETNKQTGDPGWERWPVGWDETQAYCCRQPERDTEAEGDDDDDNDDSDDDENDDNKDDGD